MQPLLDAIESMPADAEFLVWRYHGNSTNLRTQFGRIIEKAGLKPWPKLFQNLRSTRQTELMADHPMQAVCSWLGNSEKVAMVHYAQVLDSHFEAAATKVTITPPNAASGATQKAAQQGQERPRKASQAASAEVAQVPILQSVTTACEPLRLTAMTPAGFEPASLP